MAQGMATNFFSNTSLLCCFFERSLYEKIRIIVFPIAAILTIILTRFVLNLIFSDVEKYGATRNLFPVTGKDWEVTLIICIVMPPVWFAFGLFSAVITYFIEVTFQGGTKK